MAYDVKILADSCNDAGIRLVTWQLTYQRFVHSELLTHRWFSRNSSSSRAIPTPVLLKQVSDDPAGPIWWGKNQSGMQARTELSEESPEPGIASPKKSAQALWHAARVSAIGFAEEMHKVGLHKQIANRVIEPWMWITVLVSTTHHQNWFALRDHEDAQPEIAWIARRMHEMYNATLPTYVRPGNYHVPFLFDLEDLAKMHFSREQMIRIAIGRCARVSYLTHEGVRDPLKDLELCEELMEASPPHMSPFEHVAISMNGESHYGNFQGWRQYRKNISNEAGPREIRYMNVVRDGTSEEGFWSEIP